MPSSTKFCKSVSQSTGGRYVTWDNLNNIKTSASGAYAVSHELIQGKNESKNRPSTINCSNFGFNLPTGAEPTKVIVAYNHLKVAGSDYSSKYPKRIVNIPAPTITLLGVNGFTGKGVAPTLDWKRSTKTFNVSGKVSRTQINSSNFGVKIDYPTNSNGYNGYMRIGYVTITVEYKTSSYSLSVKKAGGTGYNGEDYTVQLSISNKNKTDYNPSVTLTSPAGFSFKSAKGTGKITQKSVSSFTWNPKLSRKVGTSSINVVFVPDVTYPSGSDRFTGTFVISESLNGASASLNAVITPRPPSEHEETETGDDTIDMDKEKTLFDEIVFTPKGESYQCVITLTDEEIAEIDDNSMYAFAVLPNPNYEQTSFSYDDRLRILYDPNNHNYYVGRSVQGLYLKMNNYVLDNLLVFDENQYVADLPLELSILLLNRDWGSGTITSSDIIRNIKVNVIPNNLTVPSFSLLELTNEELDRLGTGYPYIVQSYLKHSTTDDYVRDWYKNNRIGVFNNAIEENIIIIQVEDPETGEIIETVDDSTDYDNLTIEEIFTHAEYWSEAPTSVNEYNNLECEFVYNEKYPLYIIFTGDYQEAGNYDYDMGTISYTEPAIIEKSVYNGREQNGNFPEPINNLILNDGSSAELTIPVMNNSTPITFYEYPLDEGYGTNETQSIRGIEIRGTIQQTDELVLTAKLISSTGATGERTIKLDSKDSSIDSDTEFSLGGLGDLWGFSTADMKELEDWEVQITVNNILLDSEANINFGDVQLIIYTEALQEQEVVVLVNGEDLRHYGAVLIDREIEEGLKTDTDFLNIKGTDTNVPYRQNIREKYINIELRLGSCDLQTSSSMLRQLTYFLLNDRDKYDRPIPNIIEFSDYDDVYFEYLIEDTLDVSRTLGYYIVKAKLTIPAGTAYANEQTVTNITGFVQGIAAINPVITFKPQAETIVIKELISGQEFNMGYAGDWQNGIVEINCEDHVALLKSSEEDTNPIDISNSVDFNADWFSLFGEYSFSAGGCVIRTVEFTERR